jgi:hypothetical protein
MLRVAHGRQATCSGARAVIVSSLSHFLKLNIPAGSSGIFQEIFHANKK